MRPTVQVRGGERVGERLRRMAERVASRGVYVGVPRGAGSYEDGTKIAVIAAVQEYGSRDGLIPERSFLRVPLRSNQELWGEIMRRQLPKVLRGELTLVQLLEQLGQRAVGVSQEAISQGIPPPNAESTIRQKNSTTPLVGKDGALRQAITYVVPEGDDDA